MRLFGALLIAFSAAAPVLAHLVDVLPSTCAVDVQLSASGTAAVVDPPGPGELLRVVYTPNSSPERSRLQVCSAAPGDSSRCGVAIPRGFTLGATQGTLTLPTAFNMLLRASGELRADAVPLTVTVDGSPVTVPFDLTTGFVLTGDDVAVGHPILSTGAVEVMGSGRSAALPPPLTDAELRLALGCVLDPVPDLDQFALGARLTSARGTITAKRTKLTIAVDPGGATADFAAPAIVRLVREDTPLAVVVVPGGLAKGSRRRFTGEYATGSVLVVPKGRGLKVVLQDEAGSAGPFASGAGDLEIEVGGLFARRAVAFRANRAGARMTVRAQ